MSFGKKLLEKYGWAEGEGLGKEKQGISKAINPAAQTTQKGIGAGKDNFANWWDDLYASTLSKISLKVDTPQKENIKDQEDQTSQEDTLLKKKKTSKKEKKAKKEKRKEKKEKKVEKEKKRKNK